MPTPEGRAIIYCQGRFAAANGKTAHGLVRRTRRYEVVGVVDATLAGQDAGTVLDGRPRGIGIFPDVAQALEASRAAGRPASHLVVGLAPDGGRLTPAERAEVLAGLGLGLNLDAGLHQFFSEDPEFAALARERGLTLRDVRKPPPRDQLHFFSGKITEVTSLVVAILGTDSAIGKRTTAWMLTEALEAAGVSAVLVGTGQTAWLQGAPYGIILDSLVNDFVSGEIEHAVHTAWAERRPRVIVVEGQGSLMNPAYPGGFEILAAARPRAVVLQHAPARREYDGFPGYPLHPLATQIAAIELISGRPVVAVTINHEDLDREQAGAAAREITARTGLPAVDVLWQGAGGLVEVIARLAPPAGAGA